MTCREIIIQSLPKEWDNKDTRITGCGAITVAANPNLAPMMYKNGKWEEIKWEEPDRNLPPFKQEAGIKWQ